MRSNGEIFGTLCALDPNASSEGLPRIELIEPLARLTTFHMEAVENQRFRELVLGMIGHDLRSPLQALTLQTTIALKDPTLQPRTRQMIERSAAAAAQMARLTSDLLDFAQIRQGSGLTLRPESVDVPTLIDRVLNQAFSSEQRQRVEVDTVGICTLSADPNRLYQLVQNLVGNALSHSPEGSPVTVSADGSNKNELVFEFHNGGKPIPTAVQREIFAPFRSSGDGGDDRGKDNAGLGLYIVAEVVRLHRGEIELRSDQDTGTTFRIVLPRNN